MFIILRQLVEKGVAVTCTIWNKLGEGDMPWETPIGGSTRRLPMNS